MRTLSHPIKDLPPTLLGVLFVLLGSWGRRVRLACSASPQQDGRPEGVMGHTFNPGGKGKWICEVGACLAT